MRTCGVILFVMTLAMVGCAALALAAEEKSARPAATARQLLPTSQGKLHISAEKPGWILEMRDEFDKPSLNTDLWIPEYLAYRTSAEKAAARYEIRDGCLALRIDANQPTYFKSGMKVSSIQTGQRMNLHKYGTREVPTVMKYTPLYGYFEIRAKPYCRPGYCTTFWTVGRKDEDWQTAEIDISEQPGNKPRSQLFNLHRWADKTLSENRNVIPLDFDSSEQFATYGLEWEPNAISLYINGKCVKALPDSPTYPAVFFLSIYEGEGWAGQAETRPESGYPKEYLVDYFRAYRRLGTATVQVVYETGDKKRHWKYLYLTPAQSECMIKLPAGVSARVEPVNPSVQGRLKITSPQSVPGQAVVEWDENGQTHRHLIRLLTE